MKTKAVASLAIAALAILAFAGCQHTERHEASDTAKKQYTCEMHPEVVSDHPGKCPKCNMELTEKNSPTYNRPGALVPRRASRLFTPRRPIPADTTLMAGRFCHTQSLCPFPKLPPALSSVPPGSGPLSCPNLDSTIPITTNTATMMSAIHNKQLSKQLHVALSKNVSKGAVKVLGRVKTVLA
jgi:hypothetical protein